MGGLLSCSFGEWLGAGSGLTGGEEGGGEDDVAGVDFGDVEGIEEGLAVAFAGDGDGGAIAEDGADVAVVVRGDAVDVSLGEVVEGVAGGEDAAEVCVGAFDGAFLEGAVGVAVEDADGVLGGAEVFDGGGGAEFGAAVGEGDGEEAGRFDAVSAEALGEVLVGGGDAGGGFMLEENGDEEVAV